MSRGNIAEQPGPWTFFFTLDRFKIPKYTKPRLVYAHCALKAMTIVVLAFQHRVPSNVIFEDYTEMLYYYLVPEIRVLLFISAVLLDFQVTKSILGPRLVGLHHGFKRDEETGKLHYHYYAEKDFFHRYSALDRDSFFTFLVFPLLMWSIFIICFLVRIEFYLASLAALGFFGVYLNLYLFVQVRYNQQWKMSTFFSTWAYHYFIQIHYIQEDETDAPIGCRGFGYARDYRR